MSMTYPLSCSISADCPPFDPVPLNTMELDSNAAAPVGTVITFRCTLGYEFRTENSAEVNATCQTDDTWTQVNDCQSEHFITCPIHTEPSATLRSVLPESYTALFSFDIFAYAICFFSKTLRPVFTCTWCSRVCVCILKSVSIVRKMSSSVWYLSDLYSVW